jgi:hypothetical protein
VNNRFELVRLLNGTFSIRSVAEGETFHPVAGPMAEAEALYVRQLRLRERAARCDGSDVVIWDVGLGAGGNAMTVIRRLNDIEACVRIVSFDRTPEALKFALTHAEALEFPVGFEGEISRLLAMNRVEFNCGSLRVSWDLQPGDFPSQLAAAATQRVLPPPHAIFFDAFSPARNPEMWTLTLFENLFRCLVPRRPCALATFSRSTAARVAMLLGGFFVGRGEAVAGKEETTIAANTLELIERPLDLEWLQRARISRNAEPLRESQYTQAPLSPETWERLRSHRQFAL